MRKENDTPKFGPGRWVTMRDSGEHVKVESWSTIAAAYRVRSRKRGVQFASEGEVAEICAHPEEELGKHWSRCTASGCGAPLTPELTTCPRCQALTCTCGRCRCDPKMATRAKAARKKPGPKAR